MTTSLEARHLSDAVLPAISVADPSSADPRRRARVAFWGAELARA